jgi:hypothetical protein
MKKLAGIVIIFAFLTAAILSFSSCNDISVEVSETISDYSEEESKEISDASAVSETVSEESNQPEYTDSYFEDDVFIKCCDVSSEPNYESVYRFATDGAVTYSQNMYEGFWQSTKRYFVRSYKNKPGYEIWTYEGTEKEEGEVFFSVTEDNQIKARHDSPCSFINQAEFNSIYSFHTDWNQNAY